MLVVLEQVCLIFLFTLTGYILGKTKAVDSSKTSVLSALSVYVFLPAMVMKSFATQFTLTYIQEKYGIMLISLALVGVITLIGIPLSRLLTKNAYRQKVIQYSLVIPSYGYIGYALVESAFGPEVLQDMMMFTMPLTVYIYTAGYSMLTGEKIKLKSLIKPSIVAMVLGMIVGLSGVQIPAFGLMLLNKASACTAPVSMLLTGIVISEYKLKDMLCSKMAYAVTLLRLVVLPVGAAFLFKLLKLEWMMLPAVITLAMPCGMNTIVFPRLVGEDCKPGAALTFISTILCCGTIPLCMMLLEYLQ